jgi:flagellin
MGLRINTNVSSLASQRALGKTNMEAQNVLSKLSSGTRIVRASDDAAGLAISEKLKGNIRSVDQASRNANDGISFLQTAEGGLNEVSSMLIRLRELAMQSASDTVGESEREFSNLEFQNLKSEIERIAQSTEFNGTKLLNGTTKEIDFQIGINNIETEDRVSYDTSKINSTLDQLAFTDANISSKESSREGLNQIDTALHHISGQRAVLGATQNRLISTNNGLEVLKENLSAANSRIRDTDFATETAKNAQLNILQNAGTSVLGQANASGMSALKLIG